MNRIRLLILLAVLIPLAISDLERRKIPLLPVLLGFGAEGILLVLSENGPAAFLTASLKCLAATGLLLLTVLLFDHLFARKTMGGGDLRFLSLIFFSLPLTQALISTLYGLIAAAFVILVRLFMKKRGPIPLTPCLLFGLEITLLIS